MIRDMIKKLYFRVSPVRRSTARTEELLAQVASRLDLSYGELSARLAELETSVGALACSREGWNELFGILEEKRDATESGGRTEEDYIRMQREFYNDQSRSPELIVGSYEWHEEFPYETFLLYRNGDVRMHT